MLIGLGSNRGDSRDFVLRAMTRLESFSSGKMLRSHLWQTSPVDCPSGSQDFINAAVAFEARPALCPELLLAGLKSLEHEFGRKVKRIRNAPREIDLDLLLFDDHVRNTADFTLPHPRAVNRLFVLAPAAEVLPEAVWPSTGRTIRQLLGGLETDERVTRLEFAPR
ncbi:MAG: 2-amino-4-hydroxy-6-hydroxymethyldihydropteridine diphosphokinase [Gammaproteobacteria bacterium]|nr:2-amino-4-hydroxy-6-hydroxymethyldihydropteridine diphosphokinase [Gammaproteobacteria bacterium]